MSDIKEIAKQHLADPTINGNSELITDLLAELERVEQIATPVVSGDVVAEITRLNKYIAELEAENERMKADLSGRLFVEQAAERAKMKAVQECVEIANKLVHVDCADQWSITRTGAFIAFADAIKSHFKLEGK